jgi:hypothetical protein
MCARKTCSSGPISANRTLTFYPLLGDEIEAQRAIRGFDEATSVGIFVGTRVGATNLEQVLRRVNVLQAKPILPIDPLLDLLHGSRGRKNPGLLISLVVDRYLDAVTTADMHPVPMDDTYPLQRGVKVQRFVRIFNHHERILITIYPQPMRLGSVDNILYGPFTRHTHQRDIGDSFSLNKELDLLGHDYFLLAHDGAFAYVGRAGTSARFFFSLLFHQ